MEIYVIEGGFVYVGKGEAVKDDRLGDCVLISDCYNIRSYGTTDGLSQLTYQGKQKETILDRSMPITVPLGKIILSKEVRKDVQHTFSN